MIIPVVAVRGILALVRERSAGRRGGAVRRLWAEGDVPWTAVPGITSARSTLIPVVRDDFLSHMTDLTVEQVKPSSPSPPPRPRGRERAVVFTGADAASRFQRRFSAAPALFLIVGTGTAADQGLKRRGLIDIHGRSPAVGALRRVLRQGDAGLV
jgi:hypothetical protein